MMQSKAPEKRFDKNLSFDCPRDAAWRRADCNSPIGRECSVPKPEHIGWPQDHWMAAHQSRRALRSCQMSLPQRNPQVRHQSLARLNAWLHRRSCLDGGGPVPLAARSQAGEASRPHLDDCFIFFLPYARRQQDFTWAQLSVSASLI
ncbi:hypothetical protein HDV62DRAFT_342462 [Trichoderma sp. SZMC 28011]